MQSKYCGELTKDGMPCNMLKGHHVKYHRYRDFDGTMEWRILSARGTVLEYGSAKLPLHAAISKWSFQRKKFTIEVEVR